MHTLLQEQGIALTVLVFPMVDQVDERYRKLAEAYILYPQRQIRAICDDYGIPMLDLTEAIYREGGTTLFRDHLHLNTQGNDVVTNELEKYLVDTLDRQL